jgi:hypothetical protein
MFWLKGLLFFHENELPMVSGQRCHRAGLLTEDIYVAIVAVDLTLTPR